MTSNKGSSEGWSGEGPRLTQTDKATPHPTKVTPHPTKVTPQYQDATETLKKTLTQVILTLSQAAQSKMPVLGNTVSPLRMNEFRSKSTFVSPICSLSPTKLT